MNTPRNNFPAAAPNITITVSDRRTAPSSLTLARDENLFARHCAVVRPGRAFREVGFDGLPAFPRDPVSNL